MTKIYWFRDIDFEQGTGKVVESNQTCVLVGFNDEQKVKPASTVTMMSQTSIFEKHTKEETLNAYNPENA